jgi:peptide/nickel transport system permease protein
MISKKDTVSKDLDDSNISQIKKHIELRRILKNKLFVIGLVIVFIICFAAVAAPLLTPYNPNELDTKNALLSVSMAHPFGTDEMGRDIYTRVLYGSRISLRIGFLCAFFSGIIGIFFGLLSGYYRRFDLVFSRLVDGLMVFPGLIMGILFMAALGPSQNNVIIAMTILYTPRIIRIVRSSVIEFKSKDFVDAARVIGGNDARILIYHILPNSYGPIIVQIAFGFAWAILVESGMSFLGLGMPPPAPSWGNIITDGRQFLYSAPWIMLFPGLAISLAVMGLNFIGDGLRDLLDPRLRNAAKGTGK